MNDKSKYWIEAAKEDIEVANVLLSGAKLLYSGFMCHLAVEKALKAKVQSLDDTPPKIHNLVRLANMGQIYDELLPETQRFLASLNPLQIEARYPQIKSAIAASLTKEICMQLIKDAKEFVEWIETLL